MRFIVHVVEETSIHKKIDEKYFIQKCDVGENNEAHILMNDSFYIVEASDSVEAVIEIANIIQVEDEDGDMIKLGLILKRQRDIEDENYINKLESFLSEKIIEDQTNSKLYSSTYQLEKKINDEDFIELHKIFFYVIKEIEIMQVLNKS